MMSFTKQFHDYFQQKERLLFSLLVPFQGLKERALFGTVCCYNSEEKLTLIKLGTASVMKIRGSFF